MTQSTGEDRAARVRAMFTRIAGRYNLMNRLMTAGRDVRWRKQAAGWACLQPGGALADMGTGTGVWPERRLLRGNVIDLPRALQEQVRVLQSGGRKSNPVYPIISRAARRPISTAKFVPRSHG